MKFFFMKLSKIFVYFV